MAKGIIPNGDLGRWSYGALVIIALVLGLLKAVNVDLGMPPATMTTLLVTLGLLAGFMGVMGKGVSTQFLIIVLVLPVVAGSASVIPLFGPVMQDIAGTLAVGLAPSALVIAVSSLFQKAGLRMR